MFVGRNAGRPGNEDVPVSSVSTKPYLIRAIFEWCVDQGLTPYVAAVVDGATRVPPSAARDGQVVLNMSPAATHQLDMGNDLITFQARFDGVAHSISIPVDNVVAVYARENGHGMAFEIERADTSENATAAPEGDATGAEGPDADAPERAGATDTPPKPDKPSSGGRSHLKVIK